MGIYRLLTAVACVAATTGCANTDAQPAPAPIDYVHIPNARVILPQEDETSKLSRVRQGGRDGKVVDMKCNDSDAPTQLTVGKQETTESGTNVVSLRGRYGTFVTFDRNIYASGIIVNTPNGVLGAGLPDDLTEVQHFTLLLDDASWGGDLSKAKVTVCTDKP